MRLRRTIGALSIFLTSALISGLSSSCGPVTNNWIDHRLASDAVYDSSKVAGSSARELLKADTFKSLLIRVQYVPGFGPSQEAKNRLLLFLKSYLKKPNGISIQDDPLPTQNRATWSVSDVRDLEDRTRNHFSQKDQFVVYYWFLDGHSVDDLPAGAKLLGQAFRNSSIVVYEQTLREEAQKSAIGTQLVETTLMEHEFGHLMGLVNFGIPTQNPATEDRGNPTHCSHKECLMYYAADTTAILTQLSGATTRDLDPECKRDLEAAQK
jgi:hypothetical protein